MTSILVASKEADARKLVATVLHKAGLDTHTASSLAQGDKLIESRSPGLVVLDTTFGPDLAAWCRQPRPNPPLVLVIANAEEADALLDAGVDDVIQRPISERILVHRVQRLLAGREMDTLRQQLVERSLQLEGVLSSMSDGVHVIVIEMTAGAIQRSAINPALYSLLGYEAEELQTPEILQPESISPEGFAEMKLRICQAILSNERWRQRLPLKRRDGRVIDCEVTLSPLVLEDGRVSGVVGVYRDMTLENSLRDQQRQFVASAAHELRTPLASIKSRIFLARRQPEKMPLHLDTLDQITDRLEHLVEDLLDFSRYDHGLVRLNLARFDLVRFIRDSVLLQEAQAEGKDIWLIDRLPYRPIYVQMDSMRMMQVFSNLLNNAITFTPEGGAVIIRTREGKNEDELGYVITDIDDTGSGIHPSHLPHIFEPFYRIDSGSKGLGLGLSIIKEIVELHHGKITVRSELGKGSCFSVWLPTLAEDAEALSSAEAVSSTL